MNKVHKIDIRLIKSRERAEQRPSNIQIVNPQMTMYQTVDDRLRLASEGQAASEMLSNRGTLKIN